MALADSTRRRLQLLVGIVASSLGIVLALRHTSLAELESVLLAVDPWWLVAIVALKFAAVVLKALRWRIELGAMEVGSTHRVFHATGLGYFCNLLLPFKLGELIRVSLLRRHNQQIELGEALASIAAERVLDGAVLALMVLVALPGIDAPPWVKGSTWILLAVTMGVVAVSTLAPLHHAVLRALPSEGLLSVIAKVVRALHRGTAVMRRPGPLLACIGVTAVIWVAEVGTWHLAMLAVGLEPRPGETLVIAFLLTFALLVPSAPGQVGTLQAMAVYLMAPFGIEAGPAVSASLLLQLGVIASLGSVGLYVLGTESSARRALREGRASLDRSAEKM